jgi:hypothetical protein
MDKAKKKKKMMHRPWRRVIVDSRYKLAESISHSDFKISLPFEIRMERGTKMFVDQVSLSHSWSTVEVTNQNIFVQEFDNNATPPLGLHERVVQLPLGLYSAASLRTQLQASLNTGTHIQGVYAVTLANSKFLISWTDTAGHSSKIKIHTRADIEYLKNVHPHFQGNWGNELIGATLPHGYFYQGQPLYLSHVDLMAHKTLHLCCPTLGETGFLALDGSTDVVKRVVLGNTMPGETINDAIAAPMAPIIFEHDSTLKVIHFVLRDWEGKPVNLSGHEISFELIFEYPGDAP